MKSDDDDELDKYGEIGMRLDKQFRNAMRMDARIPTAFGDMHINVDLDPEKADAEMALYNRALAATIKQAATLHPSGAPSILLQTQNDNTQPLLTETKLASQLEESVVLNATPIEVAPNRSKNIAKFSQFRQIFFELREKKWASPSTKKQYDGLLDIFEKIFGDQDMDLYTEEQAIRFETCIRTMPSRWLQSEKTRILSYDEVIKLNKPTVTKDTADGHISKIKAFFSRAKILNYATDNIFQAIEIDRNVEKTSRDSFTEEALTVLFNEDNFLDFQKEGFPSHYWVPLLAVFTGARRAEMFYLVVDNIYQSDEIWVIDITNESIEDEFEQKDSSNISKPKSIKNKPSKRQIPIHKKLIDLGFLQFVDERRKDTKDQRLFKEYPITKVEAGGGFTYNFRKWIDKLKANLDPKQAEELFPKFRTLHAFRHLFISETREQEMTETVSRKLTGHAVPGANDTHNTYGRRASQNLQRRRLVKLNDELQNMDPSNLLPPLKAYSEMMSSFQDRIKQKADQKKREAARIRQQRSREKKRNS